MALKSMNPETSRIIDHIFEHSKHIPVFDKLIEKLRYLDTYGCREGHLEYPFGKPNGKKTTVEISFCGTYNTLKEKGDYSFNVTFSFESGSQIYGGLIHRGDLLPMTTLKRLYDNPDSPETKELIKGLSWGVHT